MTDVTTRHWLDRWERRTNVVVNVVPYLALAASVGLGLGVAAFQGGVPVPAMLVLTAVAGGWMVWWVTLHPAWAARRGLMVTYYVVLLGLMAALIACTSLFGFFAFAGYLHAAHAMRGRWIFAGVAATAVLSAVAQVGGFPTLASPGGQLLFAGIAAFNVAIAGVMTLLAWVTTEQASRRKNMIAELARANEKLAAAMAENEGLHAQLVAQAREAGVLDERQRLAGEIHDTLAQGLIGIVTQLEAAQQAGPGSEEGRRYLHTAARLARDGLTEARRSVHALQPAPLEGASLADALAGVVRDWSAVTGTRAELVVTGTARRVLPEIEAALLRTGQEALANVAKHADAHRVGLTLSYMEDVVTLDVRDDGRGFDPAGAPEPGRPDGGGFGLTAMRERLGRLAGSLAVESEPGAGTAVSACLPAVPVGSAG